MGHFFILIMIGGCDIFKQSELPTDATKSQFEQNIVPERKINRFSLDWEYFENEKEFQDEIEKCFLLDNYYFLFLYYSLLEKHSNKTLSKLYNSKDLDYKSKILSLNSIADQVSPYETDYVNAKNEFERKEIVSKIEKMIHLNMENIKQANVFCRESGYFEILKYDFKKSGFPLENESIYFSYSVEDGSKYAIETLEPINRQLSIIGHGPKAYRYFPSYINVTNKKDKNFRASFIKILPEYAKLEANNFFSLTGGGRGVKSYLIFEAESAKPIKEMMGGKYVFQKNVFVKLRGIVFFNKNDKVIGILKKTE